MIAHGYSKAGALATYIHSESARKILAQKSSRLIASDLLKNIGIVMNELENKSDQIIANYNLKKFKEILLGLELLRFISALAILIWHYQHFNASYSISSSNTFYNYLSFLP